MKALHTDRLASAFPRTRFAFDGVYKIGPSGRPGKIVPVHCAGTLNCVCVEYLALFSVAVSVVQTRLMVKDLDDWSQLRLGEFLAGVFLGAKLRR